MKAYEKSTRHSIDKLTLLRKALADSMPVGCTVITYGSYARHEASDESDLDYVVVSDVDPSTDAASTLMDKAKEIISGIVPIQPSEKGAFANLVSRSQLLSNVGGSEDTNDTITRRVLLLLEGQWLTNESEFRGIRRELIEKYVAATLRDHQIALFLLNDVIRYWRTMTVDYTFKASASNKPWAIRNIKLMFSRKLMYAGGMFSVGATAHRGQAEKADTLESLLDKPPIERLQLICGEDTVRRALESYDRFLEWMSQAQTREYLNKLAPGDHNDVFFRTIKNEGHRFTRELHKVFETTFDSTHPIRGAIIF